MPTPTAPPAHLRPVPLPAASAGGASAADLGLLLGLLAFAVVPLAGLALGARFGPGEVGAGAGLALVTAVGAVRSARDLLRRGA